jgi:hypothetical protein
MRRAVVLDMQQSISALLLEYMPSADASVVGATGELLDLQDGGDSQDTSTTSQRSQQPSFGRFQLYSHTSCLTFTSRS